MNIVQAHAQHRFTPLTLVPTLIHEHAQVHTQHHFTPLTLMPTFIHEHCAGPRTAPFETIDTHAHFNS
jgi:hypothetical protein